MESSTPSKFATSEARPTTPFNGTLIQQTSTAGTSQVQLLSSYASVVDLEEGTDLKYIATHTINRVRCATLEKEDVAVEIEYWQQPVLCSVLGANPPFKVMQGLIKRIWAPLDIDKIIYVRKGVFLVWFDNL